MEIKKLRYKLLAKSYTFHGTNLGLLFDEIDADKSGVIDIKELSNVVKRLLPDVTTDQLNLLMGLADEDNSGALDRGEFIAFVENRSRFNHKSSSSGSSGNSAAATIATLRPNNTISQDLGSPVSAHSEQQQHHQQQQAQQKYDIDSGVEDQKKSSFHPPVRPKSAGPSFRRPVKKLQQQQQQQQQQHQEEEEEEEEEEAKEGMYINVAASLQDTNHISTAAHPVLSPSPTMVNISNIFLLFYT